MSKMANPMEALSSYQQALNTGWKYDHAHKLDEHYRMLSGKVKSGKKIDFIKIVKREVHALAIFGEEEPFEGINRYSIGYAVSEKNRGNGLAFEAVNKGIEELKNHYRLLGFKSFYIEALIDEENTHSLKVAEKLFTTLATSVPDEETGTPALLFYKIITV